MHYYQHHIGDFIKDTANLNDHQLATYLRMLWSYYSEERPLGKSLEDLAFAMRSDEKTVGLILRHYFKEAEDGWHHGRCDREIADFHTKKDKAAASANARWKNAKNKTDAKQAQCDSNASACDRMQAHENHGENTYSNGAENASRMRPHSERNANALKTDANQEPRTKNQSKEPLTHNAGDASAPVAMTLEWQPDEKLLQAYAKRAGLPVSLFTHDAIGVFVCHYAASGRAETQAAWVSLLVKWLKRDVAQAGNVRPFPQRRQASGPDFHSGDTSWADDLGEL